MVINWENNIMDAIRELKIIKDFSVVVDNQGNGLEVNTIHRDHESNRFIVRKDRKRSSLFEVEFFKDHSPKRTCNKLTEKEVMYVVRRYCVV